MFENVDRQRTYTGVIGILLAHLGDFRLGELKKWHFKDVLNFDLRPHPSHEPLSLKAVTQDCTCQKLMML